MKSQNNLLADLLDFDTPQASQDVLWTAGVARNVSVRDGYVAVDLEFSAQAFNEEGIAPDKNILPKRHTLWVSAYGEEIVRLTIDFSSNDLPATKNDEMLEIDERLEQLTLSIYKKDEGWKIIDPMGKTRMEINTQSPAIKHWSDLIPGPPETLQATIYPDDLTSVS